MTVPEEGANVEALITEVSNEYMSRAPLRKAFA